MKKQIQRYAGVLLASAVMIGGIASAANVDPIPTISNTFAISGQVIKSADINKLAEGLNILDARTNNFKNNVTVTDNGNVGIGTTTPTEKLEVAGNAKINTKTGYSRLQLGDYTSNSIFVEDDPANNYGNGFFFRVDNRGANANGYYDVMKLQKNGNVLIGSLNNGEIASEQLQVNGNVKATAFLYSSDERLKGNISPLENVLEKVEAMKGVNFDWKKDGKHDIGLIAQDVQKQFPEAVSQGQDGYLAVDYSRMVPVLLEAIKEQQKEIDELQCKLGDCK